MPKIETWNTTGLEIEINFRISEYFKGVFFFHAVLELDKE